MKEKYRVEPCGGMYQILPGDDVLCSYYYRTLSRANELCADLNAKHRKENPMTKQELLDQIQGAEKAANAATAEVEELRRRLKVVEEDEKAIVWKDDGRGEYFEKDGWQVCILSGQSPFGKTSEIYNFLAVQNQSGLRFSGSGYADHAVRRFAEDWFNNGCKCQ